MYKEFNPYYSPNYKKLSPDEWDKQFKQEMLLKKGEQYEEEMLPPSLKLKKGDIILCEKFDGPPFLRIRHAMIVLEDANSQLYISGNKFIVLPAAECGSGGGCQETERRFKLLKSNDKTSNKYIHIIRYKNRETADTASIIAKNWTENKLIKFPSIKEIPTAFARAGIFPCFKKKGDRKSGQKYINNANKNKVPVRKSGENVNMFCSKFVMGVWISAIGNMNGWDYIDKCLPIKPSNCSPSNLKLLPIKYPDCWEQIAKIKIATTW